MSNEDRKKRPRTAFTAAQIKALENEFEKNKYLSVSKRTQLSKQLKLTETQVSYFTSILRFPFSQSSVNLLLSLDSWGFNPRYPKLVIFWQQNQLFYKEILSAF